MDHVTGHWCNDVPDFGTVRNLYVEGRDFWNRFDIAFDPKALYVGYNCILVTRDGAQTWKAFSPDLTTSKGRPMVPCGVAPVATGTPLPAAPAPTPGAPTPPAPAGGRPSPPSLSDFPPS